MNSLSVDIDVAVCRTTVCFNGRGVPIELHPMEGIYMPEMVFSDFSNFEETAGGRNSNDIKMATYSLQSSPSRLSTTAFRGSTNM
jgi:DNA topoisomerase-2